MFTGEEIATFRGSVKRGRLKYLQLQAFPEGF